MKKITITLFALFISIISFAENPKYIEAMKKTIAEFDTASTPEQLVSVANKFERIATAEKSQWLPYYYSAMARATSVFLSSDVSTYDAILDVAQKDADKADSLNPNNSEIYVLKSMIVGGRIMVDPMSRGMQYGMQSGMLIQQALKLDPNNPRAYFLMGQSLLYTPEQFGGGVQKACEVLHVAQEKYLIFIPASEIHPDWGKAQLVDALKQCGGTQE